MELLPTIFSGLTPKQIKALPLLAAGMSAVDVSKKLKISQQRISEWKNDSNYQSALDVVRHNTLNEAQWALSSLANDAINTLGNLLHNAKNEQTKLRAAIFIIERLEISSAINQTNTSATTGTNDVNMNLLLTALGVQPGNQHDSFK